LIHAFVSPSANAVSTGTIWPPRLTSSGQLIGSPVLSMVQASFT